MKKIVKPVVILLIAAVILAGLRFGLAKTAEAKEQATLDTVLTLLLPGSTSFEEEEYSGEDSNITAVYKSDIGYVVETTTPGYVNDIVLLVGVNNDGKVIRLMVRNLEETYGLGENAKEVDFLAQFIGINGEVTVGEEIDAVTGATVTSKAVTKGINSAVAFVTGADVSSGATEWEG